MCNYYGRHRPASDLQRAFGFVDPLPNLEPCYVVRPTDTEHVVAIGKDGARHFPAMRWGLVALTAAIAVGVLIWMFREPNKQDQIGLGLVMGGAIGNILDRVRFGYVVDFADLHFGEWRPFLVFNVADAAITIGVLILLVRALLVRDKPRAGRASVENMNA